MEWIFVMFLNGFMVDVDRFNTRQECENKVAIYNRAGRQASGQFLVWCDRRPQA